MIDPYAILGLSPNASPTDIKARYRVLARKHHPDLGGDANIMIEINDAYDRLKSSFKTASIPKELSTIQHIFDGLIRVQIESNFKRGWVSYAATTILRDFHPTLADWQYLATRLGYKLSWATIKYNDHKNVEKNND